jgi:hypothetical protein
MFQTSPHSALLPFGTIEDRGSVLDWSHAMGGSLKSNGLAPYNSQRKGRNSLMFSKIANSARWPHIKCDLGPGRSHPISGIVRSATVLPWS